MHVVAWSRSLTPELAKELGVERKNSAIEVAEASDVTSANIALNQQTKGLLASEFFASLRKNSYFVNTSRAERWSIRTLAAAESGEGIRVALDVYANEPPGGTGEFTDPIAQQIYGTHHIGASTEQAQDAIAAMLASSGPSKRQEKFRM